MHSHHRSGVLSWLFLFSLLSPLFFSPPPLLAAPQPQTQSLGELARRLRAERTQKDLSRVPYFINENLPTASEGLTLARRLPPPPEAAQGEGPAGKEMGHAEDGRPDRSEAVESARVQVRVENFDAALEIFRRLAAANPRDFEARVWVARLEGWKGRHALAERLYREVLRDDPGNLEAELGLADVVSWQGRYDEAQELLAGLQAKHPDNLEVLLRRGKIYRWAHRRQEAVDAYEQVLALDPANREAREAVDALRAETHFQLETGYFLEEFDFSGNTQGQFVELLYQDLDRLWLVGRFQYQNKFEQDNTRYTLGATYRFFSSTYVRGEFSWAPAGDTVIANQDYTLEVTQGLHPRFSLGGSYRFLNFDAAEVQVLTALANWDLHPKLHLLFRYSPARTSFDTASGSVWNHGGWTRLVWDANRHLSPYLLFAVGSENFAGLSAEQLGRFAAQTYGIGTEVRLTPRLGLRVGYYFQNRSQGNREQGVGLSVFQRF